MSQPVCKPADFHDESFYLTHRGCAVELARFCQPLIDYHECLGIIAYEFCFQPACPAARIRVHGYVVLAKV